MNREINQVLSITFGVFLMLYVTFITNQSYQLIAGTMGFLLFLLGIMAVLMDGFTGGVKHGYKKYSKGYARCNKERGK